MGMAHSRAQTLSIADDIQTYATLTNTAVTLSGRAELRLTGTGDPMPGCTVNLNSPNAWLLLSEIQPSAVVSTFLSRVRVNGAAAVLDNNVRIVQYAQGAVVIPQPPDFAAMEVFDARYFAGAAKRLYPYVNYNDLRLGAMKSVIRSFKLKRGYMATVSALESGLGNSRVYIAQDGDLDVGRLPDEFDRDIRFVRIFPWRWVSKKGFAGTIGGQIKPAWIYNWNLDQNSSLNTEYVAIRQNRYWPGLNQDWRARGVNHLLGYNEPDHADQANLTVAAAIAGWPDLLATGLRIGSPAVSDGGKAWITDFMAQANAAGLRVDYVPIHYYRGYSNPANAQGAADQFYNFLNDIHNTVQRPLWVTEFNNGANWTSDPDPTYAQQAATVGKMIAMLDSTPWVERYSIYNWVEDVRRVVWDDGWPLDAGVVYRDKVSPLSQPQEMADAGTGNSARYDFDGNAHDSWNHGQDGMMVGAPTFTAGKYGQAILLDGEDYVQISPRIADTTNFTFAAWVYYNGGGSWQRIFDFGADTTSYLALTPKAGTAGLRFLMRNGGAEQQLNAAALATGVWTHVAVTISGDTGKLFVNGAVVDTNTAMTINPVDVGTKFNYLGKSQFGDPLFNGRLDDVRIVSSALTDAQIAAMAATGPPQFSSTALAKPSALKWQPYTGSLTADVSGGSGVRTFNKQSGPAWLAVAQDGGLTGVPGFTDGGVNNFSVRVTDANGALHTTMLQIPVSEAPGMVARYAFDASVVAGVGTAPGIANGGSVYVAGKNSQAMDLDGVDDYVTLPRGVASYPEFTIAAWINWDGGNASQRLFDFGNSGSESLFLTPKNGAGTMEFALQNREEGYSLTATPPAVGAWVHVAVTLGGTTARLFVNGVQVDADTMPITPLSFEPATNYIGKSQYDDPYFNGRVDDFVIFNKPLTAAQIAALMNGHAPAFAGDPLTKPAAPSGVAYNQSLALNASDPDAGSVLAFSKVSGPAWLTVAADGRLSGLPGAGDAGVNRFIVRVTDQTLLSDDAVLNITVPSPAGLVAHFQFDGSVTNNLGAGTTTVTGAPVYEAGLFDSALGFDGVDDAVTLPPNIAGALTDATFAVRVRWDGGAVWQRIFDIGGGTTQYMILSPSSNNGFVQFAILNPGGTAQRLEGIAPLPAGEWSHVAVTLSGNTGTLYVNGASVAAGSITIDPSAIAQTQCYLGHSQFAADPLFAGALDDFRIYNRGLTALEVAALARPAAAVSVPLDYAGWTTGISFPAGQSAAASDPDKDGVLNLFEFLLGANPLVANAATLPPAQTRTGAQLGLTGAAATRSYLTLQARVRTNRPGITLTAEAGPALSALTAADAPPAGTPVPDGEYETITWYYRIPLPAPATGKGFIRLRAVLNQN